MAAQDDNDDKLIEAMKLADEQLKVSLAGKMPYGIQFALGSKALVSRDLGNLDEAKELFEKQVGMLREMGHQSELARSLLNLSTLYNELLQLSKSASLIDEAEAIARGLGDVLLMQQARMARSFATAMHGKPSAESVVEVTDRAHEHLKKHEFQAAEKLFGEVLSRMDAPSDFKLLAHAQRAFARAEQNHLREAIEDYTSVVNWPNAPADLRAEALNNRASLFGKLKDMAKYTADLSAVIALAGTPEKLKIEATLRRGNQYLLDRSREKALLDFTFVSRSATASES
jgi:tetratricopeptide (TPR) repeat protein